MLYFVGVAAPFCARLRAIAAFHQEITGLGAQVVAARVAASREAKGRALISWFFFLWQSLQILDVEQVFGASGFGFQVQ